MRQHLTCVRAAAAICDATVDGADIGSTALTFRPGPIRGGDYHFAIGTGAVVGRCLADQLLLPLALAGTGSLLTLPVDAHVPTNIPVIETFLPVKFTVTPQTRGLVRIEVARCSAR
jgi:RNA 3'-terminal phosphate cyclase (ATP)